MKGENSNIDVEVAEEATAFFCNKSKSLCSLADYKQKILEEFYDIGQVIGKGGYGTIYCGQRKSDSRKVILKHISKSKLNMAKDGSQPLEIDILEKLKGLDGVCKLIEYFEKPDSFVIVLEDSGSCMDLFDYISEKKLVEETEAKCIFEKVVQIIENLHNHGILDSLLNIHILNHFPIQVLHIVTLKMKIF